MIRYLLFYSMLFTLSCSAPDQKIKLAPITTKKDTLNATESKFLSLVAKENEFVLLSKEMERTFSMDGELLVSKMLFSKKELTDGGYIDIDISVYGTITDRANIQYSYNMGQASYGYGTLVGDDINNYLHTIKSCGVSSCVIRIFDTGKKIFEKENAN